MRAKCWWSDWPCWWNRNANGFPHFSFSIGRNASVTHFTHSLPHSLKSLLTHFIEPVHSIRMCVCPFEWSNLIWISFLSVTICIFVTMIYEWMFFHHWFCWCWYCCVSIVIRIPFQLKLKFNNLKPVIFHFNSHTHMHTHTDQLYITSKCFYFRFSNLHSGCCNPFSIWIIYGTYGQPSCVRNRI